MALVNHLVVFARQPRLGAVKTRLGSEIGIVPAGIFYRRALGLVLGRLGRDSRWRPWLAVTPDRGVDGPWPLQWTVFPQGPGGLGRRMARALATLPPGPVAIVGADVPDIRPAHVARAFRALGAHPAVFGPAADGGYWLVGLRRRPPIPGLFEGVRWSTRHALADTLANLDRPPALIDTLDDVDDRASWERWRARAKG
ncbi:MAG: glycosyltransferase [Proteobacteria bacterium]|nr:glycosyltransferase [Pseudomonadota bacterium]